MATWDEIKRNRQAQARPSASAKSWEEIKRQRGYKPVESPPVASPTPATRQYAPVDMRSPSLIRAAEEAVARAMETGDTSQMAALVGKPDLLSPVKPSDMSPDVFTAYKPGLNVGESFVYGSGKTAEGLAGVGNAVVFAPAEFLYGGLGALTGLFGDNAVSDWFYEQSRKSAEMDIFGEKKLSEALESKYGEKLSDADRTVGGMVKSGAEMLGSVAIGNVAGAALGAPSMLAGSTKAITPSLVSRSVFTANAYRGAVEEALSDGASIEEASAYGALAATVSTAVESIADGIPGLDNPNSITSKIFNKLKQTPQALKVFASIAGEGGEEVIEEIITPYVKRMTYDPKAETATLNDLAIAFASGSVLSGLMQGGAGIAGGLAYGKMGTPQTQIDAPSLDFDTKQKAIIEKILRGEEISGNQAEIIAKSPDAITFLRLVTGQEINTDAPISSLKRDIRALATGRATVDTQKGAQTAVATPTTAYGKAGQKAVKELQLPNQPRAQYQSDFSKFYQAGVTGTKFENIPYTGILTEPQRRGAYIAGQADAETSLAEEKYNAQFATVYKDDAGLIRNDYTPKLSKEETSFINTLFKAAGVKGEFAAPTGDKGANGWIENGIVKIAQDAADPFMVVAKHEITHRMQVIAPEAYRQYRDYAINAIGEDVVENKRAFYESRGINLTYEQAMDEVAADFTEALLTDKSKIERLVSDNRTLAQRFFDALKEFVANVKAAFKGKAAQDAALAKYGVTIERLEKATQLWENALKTTAETVRASEDATTAETDIQFSLKDYDTLLESGETGTAFNPYSGYYTIVMNGTAFGDFDTENEATHFLETNRKHLEIVDPNADGLPLFDTNEFYKQAGNQFELNKAYQQYESSKTKKTSINTILMNLSNYRDADLYSLAEQVSNGNWDGYEELSRPELEAAIRDVLNERAGDLNALEQQSPKYGFFVRPIVDNKIPATDPDARYSLKDSEGNALTPEQVEFFKDSKVRDENGNLLVVYHGTSEQFTVFDRTKGRSGMDIQGSFFSPWELDAKGYGDRVGAYYLNIVNPADEGTAYKALNRFKGQNYAGIKAREYLESLGYDGVNNNNEEYIAFSPEQIKSVDNKNPTSDPDIRYSLKGSKEYEQEIKEQKERARKAERRVARLEELNQRLKEQMKVTKLVKTDRKALESLAREIIREYDIEMNAKDLVADLDEIYTFMANGKDSDGNDLTWETLKEKAVNLGRHLVSNASVLSNELQDDYRDMVRYFKGTRVKVGERNGKPQYKYEGGVKLKLPDHFKSDMNDFNYFRKKHMGKFTFSNDGTPIDMVYAELSEMFPGYFNEDRYMTQPDQLWHIAEVMDQIKPKQKNPYAGQMEEAAEIMANDIIERFYELPQQAPTFADKQARKYTERVIKDKKKLDAKNERIAELIAEGRQRVKEIIRREAERREAAVAKIKEHYKAKDAKTRDLQQRRELRNKIKRQINTLSQMLLRPSDTKHIPEALRKPIAEFLASIDLSTDRMGDNTLRRLDKLKAAYQKILEGASDVQAEIDPDIIAKIEELSDALETKKLSELSRDELQNLWEITKGMRKAVTDYNKLFAQNIRETVSEMGTAAINEQGTKAYTESALRIKQSLANLVNMDMLDSFSFFEQLGPTMQRLFQNIRDGLDVKITHTKEAADYMIDLLRDTKIDEWTGSKAKAKTFVTSVGKISLTPSQVMSLYLLNRQPEAQNHIYAGGIKAAPVVTRAGENRLPKITKSFETLKVTPDDVNNIINSLSAEQKRIAEGISKFFTDYTAKWGNEVSMTLYGYEKFKVENYFPIVSDKNYISQVYGEVTDKTLKNMGITKARIEGANNPIIIEDAFDVFARHADAMASYHAFVVPLTDIQRVWNFKTPDGSVKQAIEKRYGQRALSYFSRLITDINGGARVEAGSEFVNTLIGRYKASRVGMNLRVVVQQPTSIIRASVMIDPKYLAKGATKKGNWNTVLKYAPIAQWKDWGYFNLYTGKQLKDIFLNKHRASDTFMLAAGKADQLAWQVMWNACEYEVQDTHPSLTKGSEEYYQAVAKRFSDIIDRTQVVDSVLHRTQIMRSKDTLVKMSVAFMTEPMKSYNLFRLAAQDYMQNKTSEAKKRLARTVVGLAATAVINSAIASLVDALRDDEDELSYWEKWLSSFADDVKWVVPEMFPYVKDLTSMLRGYDIKRMDMAGIGDLLNAIKMLASDKYTPQAKVANVIAKSADLFGIPASAIKREISTIINNAMGVFDNVVLEYETEKMMYDIDSSNNKGRYYDLVYRAWQKDDKTEFTKIVADLLNHGYTKETIVNAVQSRAKKTKEYTKEQANVYALVAESMKSHEFYGTLSDRYKDKAEDYAKQYANAVALRSVLEPNPDAEKIDAEIEKLRRDLGEDFYSPETQAEVIGMELEKGYTPQKWVLGADGTDKFEFDPAKYILYRVALQMVDEGNDNNSSYNSKERKAAMNLVGLSKEDQRYLEWLNKQ